MRKIPVLSIAVVALVAITASGSALASSGGSAYVPQAALAVSTTINPVADAYVDSSAPSTNYGTSTQLRVDGSPILRSYLRFNVSGVSGTVSQAILRLYANGALNSGISVHRVADNTWSETTVNYNNAPAVGSLIATSAGMKARTWVAVDVTSYVNGNGTFSFALTATSDKLLSLASREAANKPQLVVTSSGAPPTATATQSPTAPPSSTKTPTATPPPVSGTNYYVDSISGSDSNSGTSTSSPWQSLAKVSGYAFQPGDAVNFKRGSFWTGGLVISRSGASGQPITFRTYGTGAAPIIENPGQYQHSIRITGSWVVVQDFLLRNAGEAGVRIESSGSHNIVQNNEATNVGIAFEMYGAYNLVTHNYAHDLHMVVLTHGGNDDYGAEGYWIEGPNNEVSYNRCVNCRAPSYDYGYDGGGIEFYGTADYAYVHHNYVSGAQGFMEVGGGSAQHVRVAYNISDNNYDGLVCMHMGGTFSSTINDFRIENNTYLKTMTGDGYRVLDCLSSTVSTTQLIVRNNIFYSSIQSANTGTFAHNNNIYYMPTGAAVGYVLGSGEMQTDPLFANMDAGDYYLQSGSPAIDHGLSLGYNTDYDGGPVPQGAAPDIGAYEYGLQ